MTSGTTGGPRALAFSAAQLIADARQVTSTMGIRTRDLNYALIPLGHSYGLGNLAVPLIAQGVPLVCGALPLPHAIASDFRKWRPTVFPCVPAVWRALAAAGVGLASFRSLRLAVSAGSPLPPEVARDFRGRFGLPLRNFYGSSETGGIAYDRTGNSTLAGGVGRPIRAVEVTALPGHRIRIRSAAVFTRGNRGARRGLGSWIPADRVEIGARGELRLAGRRGAIVKVAGRRVNLAEIEASLRGLNGVREAWVQLGPGADAVVGAALATERPVAEIRAELLLSTAAWKIPRKWAIMPRLPLTPRGKVDSHRLSSRLFG
jgi:acyl-coenzyme A synthetase/AMP-(fatty) acid ligase